MPNLPSGLLRGFCSLSVFVFLGCQKAPQTALGQPVDNRDPNTKTSLGDSKNEFTVYGQDAAKKSADVLLVRDPRAQKILEKQALGKLAAPETPSVSAETGNNSLVLGFPLGLLGQQNVFGSVITKVSDESSETLGRLKLTDLTPIHVTPHILKASADSYVFGLVGCARDCEEGSAESLLLTAPVLGVDVGGTKVLVDLSALGKELNLIEMIDPDGEYTQLKTKSSVVKLFDYSYSTLVFDIDVTMVPKAGGDAETSFTTRWYLRLTSHFTPDFVARPAAPGVGFFMTERAKASVIQRFPMSFNISGSEEAITTHYFIKDVPVEHREAFSAAFDMWNAEFKEITGRAQLSYEYVETTDPRYPLLVTGDTRFNIVEWDLVNQAPYGGLGPSIANQHTGEILSANVLVQGPRIIQIYTKWFAAAEEHERLIAEGRTHEAEVRWLERIREIRKLESKNSERRFALKLGTRLDFRVPSQMPALEDPLFQRDDFVPVPKGFTFQAYMKGYFIDLVAHELGHNLGLRHNFRGNLGATNPTVVGGVSRSIMEYLGRAHRHLDLLGDYDTMAISYGYKGVVPKVTNHFCTDEDVADVENLVTGAAECSRDDATADPFGYFASQLDRAVDLLTARGTALAPAWTVADMDKELVTAIKGLTLYALTAPTTMETWTNFNLKEDRPTTVEGVVKYTRDHIKSRLCDKAYADILAAKETQDAKDKTLKNLSDLFTKSISQVTEMKAFAEDDFKCER